MTDITDGFQHTGDYDLRPLEDDCNLLGSLLDDCLRVEVGENLFKKVREEAWREKVKSLANQTHSSQGSIMQDTSVANLIQFNYHARNALVTLLCPTKASRHLYPFINPVSFNPRVCLVVALFQVAWSLPSKDAPPTWKFHRNIQCASPVCIFQ